MDRHGGGFAVKRQVVATEELLVVTGILARRLRQHLTAERRPRLLVLQGLDLQLHRAARPVPPTAFARHNFEEAPTVRVGQDVLQAHTLQVDPNGSHVDRRMPRAPARRSRSSTVENDERPQLRQQARERSTQGRPTLFALVLTPVPVREDARRRQIHASPPLAGAAALEPLEVLRPVLDAASFHERFELHHRLIQTLHPTLGPRERHQVIPDDAVIRRSTGRALQQLHEIRLRKIRHGDNAPLPLRQLLLEDRRRVPHVPLRRPQIIDFLRRSAVGSRLRPSTLPQAPLANQRGMHFGKKKTSLL